MQYAADTHRKTRLNSSHFVANPYWFPSLRRQYRSHGPETVPTVDKSFQGCHTLRALSCIA